MSDWQQIALGNLQTRVRHKVAVPPQGSRASMSGWRQVSLSEVVTRVTTKNVDGTNQNVLTVSAEYGLIAQESFFTKKVASKDTSGYYVVAPGQFVYNKSTSKSAAYGTVARNLSDAPGIVSPLYFVFEAKDGAALPEYLELALNSNQFFGSLAGMLREGARSHGLLNVRLKEFYAATVMLPPLPVQKRIVETTSAVEEQISALDTEAEALTRVESRLRRDLFSSQAAATMPAGKKFDMLLGRQKSARQSVGEHVHPYLRAANLGGGTLDLSDLKTMNFEPHEQQKYAVLPDDILLVEGGAGLGHSARWAGKVGGFVGFDKHVIRLRPRSGVSTAEYALHWCRWANETGRFSAQATGTGIKALGFARASKMAVPDISVEQQDEMTAPLDALGRQSDAVRAEAARLRQVRAGVLSGLLDRTIDIESAELGV
ncbi:hypothetical protein [Streptomyces microflavus]|uniref:hypothetical protein n=1 Tax=Streptomyces microflavus TaxID=1919 RepID=UPI0033AA248B